MFSATRPLTQSGGGYVQTPKPEWRSDLISEGRAAATVSVRFCRPQSDAQVEKLCFAEFELLPCARTLLKAGRPVRIGSRAFDLLVALARARGSILSKEQLLAQVWPGIFVDEGNLRSQMFVLRRTLGGAGDLIKVVPGRGYLMASEDAWRRPGGDAPA